MLTALVQGLCTAVVAASGCDQRQPLAPGIRAEVRAQVDTSLSPVADTHVRFDLPNSNQGASLTLQVSVTGKNRALLTWDTAAIRQALGGGTFETARLELTINQADNGWGASGRTISLLRLTQAWTEGGATWNCANDTVPGNTTHECAAPDVWQMGSATAPPYASTPTANAVITNGQTGVVTFDVTTDVAALLAGTQIHYGWIVRKAAEDSSGAVRFNSRESATKPQLVLALAQDTSRPAVPASTVFPDDSMFVVQDPVDTVPIYFRRLYLAYFTDAATGVQIRAFLAKYSAQVVAGLPLLEAYVVLASDPGATWVAVQNQLAAMRSEPGVNVIVPMKRRDYPVELRGRYPADGNNRSRSAWFDPLSAYTWAQQAVRATLAWGCETGTYGTYRPKVGILEWGYESPLSDLNRSAPVTFSATENLAQPEPQAVAASRRQHGAYVASALSAEGDNGSGVAGMIWRSDLRLYALGSADLRTPFFQNWAFASQLVPRMIDDSLRVLSISIAFGGPPTDIWNGVVLDSSLALMLRTSPQLLVVMSAGNDDRSFSFSEYMNRGEGTFGLEASLLRLKQQPEFAKRIMIVAGTMRGNTRWSRGGPGSGSTFIPGLTDIAAPAEEVATAGEAGVPVLVSGTSVATPMVAGVAALLWAMDSTLTPDEVSTYLINGAQVARVNPRTGTDSMPQPASDFTGASIFQLDAYGSLTLLARERPNTPICGYPVSVSGGVKLESPGASARTLPVPELNFISSLSVAQGGRLIAATEGYPPDVPRTVVIDHLGRKVGPTLANTQRVYLERDTADLRPDANGTYAVVTLLGPGDSTRGPFDLFARIPALPPDEFVDRAYVALAPSGDYAVLVEPSYKFCQVSDTAFWDVSEERTYLVSLNATGSTQLSSTDVSCFGSSTTVFGFSEVGWSHDGRRSIVASSSWSPDLVARFIRVEPPGTVAAPVTVPGFNAFQPTFAADDSLFRIVEEDPASCWLQYRRPEAPQNAVGVRQNVGFDFCGQGIVPNVPTAQAGRVSGTTRVTSPRAGAGFDLLSPARAVRAPRRSPRPWPAVRVQVN